jgi:anti-sigma factor RsiW
MNKPSSGIPASPAAPIGEADLHAFVDGQLDGPRRAELEAYLAEHEAPRLQVARWQAQKEALQGFYAPVMEEPIPMRLTSLPATRRWGWGSLAAGVAIAIVSANAAWFARGAWAPPEPARSASAILPLTEAAGTFYERAAIAHAVYAPEVRRPVEVGGDQEQALATWLSKRLGATINAPKLSNISYELVGGRLLPGGSGPVAQFMYANPAGQRLTLYVTREAAGKKTAFQFKQDGPVNVFYWVDEHFGYAISGAADRAELLRVSEEVYKQLS